MFHKRSQVIFSVMLMSAVGVWPCSPVYNSGPRVVGPEHPNCFLDEKSVTTPDSIIQTKTVRCHASIIMENGQTVPTGNLLLTQTIDSTVIYRKNAIYQLANLMENGEFWQVKLENVQMESTQPLRYDSGNFEIIFTPQDVYYDDFNFFPTILDTTTAAGVALADKFFLPYLRTLGGFQYSWNGTNHLHGVNYPTGTITSPSNPSNDSLRIAAWNGLVNLAQAMTQSEISFIATEVEIASAKTTDKWSRHIHSFPEPFSFAQNKLWLVARDPQIYTSCSTNEGFIPKTHSVILYLPDSLSKQASIIGKKVSQAMDLDFSNPSETPVYQIDGFSFGTSVLDSVATLASKPVAKANFTHANPVLKWPEYTSLGIRSNAKKNMHKANVPNHFYDLNGRHLLQDR